MLLLFPLVAGGAGFLPRSAVADSSDTEILLLASATVAVDLAGETTSTSTILLDTISGEGERRTSFPLNTAGGPSSSWISLSPESSPGGAGVVSLDKVLELSRSTLSVPSVVDDDFGPVTG